MFNKLCWKIEYTAWFILALNNSKISFIYESNFERLGRGRPKFRDVTIDVITKKTVQQKLL